MSADPAEDGETPKRMNPRHLRRTLYWLALDWILLRQSLPVPPRRETTRHTTAREYGHPAEWASDRAAEIVDKVTGWHDYLAEKRGETPPPQGAEARRLVSAWQYLEPRLEQLAELVEREALQELSDLHYRIRNTLGYNNPSVTLPMPCPSCELIALQRTVGIGHDYIACGNPECNYVVRDDEDGKNYKWLVRVCLDTLIGD